MTTATALGSAAAVAVLRSTEAIRERAGFLLRRARAGESRWFVVDDASLAPAADLVASVTRTRYPDLAIPYHSRWRHFEAGSIDRNADMRARLTDMDARSQARALIDLAVVSVLLDAGTTTARLAALLPTDRELTVVTNSVPIAARVSTLPSVNLQLLGGRVRGLTQAAVGEQTLRALDTMRVDVAFIGTNGITVRHGLSTPDSEEAAVKRAMVDCANYVVVVADSSKIGQEEFVSFAPIAKVDTVVTDTEITDADRAELGANGVDVVLAAAGQDPS